MTALDICEIGVPSARCESGSRKPVNHRNGLTHSRLSYYPLLANNRLPSPSSTRHALSLSRLEHATRSLSRLEHATRSLSLSRLEHATRALSLSLSVSLCAFFVLFFWRTGQTQ